jgi:hypothetical protein
VYFYTVGSEDGMERVTFRHHSAGGGKSNYLITTSALIPIHLSPHPIRTHCWVALHTWVTSKHYQLDYMRINMSLRLPDSARGRIIPFRLALCARVFVWLSECWHRLSCFCLVNSSFYKYESSARPVIKLWECVRDDAACIKKSSARPLSVL